MADLTYDKSATLMNDLSFRGRIKVAVLKFADSIINEQPNVNAHNTRYKWAQMAIGSSEMVAGNVQPIVVMDPAVQAAGADIDDAGLQSAVEMALQKTL